MKPKYSLLGNWYIGRTLIWMLENILTHCTSKATCIDTFPGNLKEIFLANLKISGLANKVTTIKGQSKVELRRFPFDSFDIIFHFSLIKN